MNSTWNVLSAAAVLLLTAGCAVDPFGLETERRTITVQPVRNPIVIDGEVSSGEWGHAEFHSLTDADPIPEELPPKVRAALRGTPVESSRVALLHDAENLYIAGVFQDRDVVQFAVEDQEMHFRTGDTLELFLKPADLFCYYEFYFTPNNFRTSLFYVSKYYPGAVRKELFLSGIRCAAKVNGTLNVWRDIDRGWSVEGAIPLKDLERQFGRPFDPGTEWHALLVRYNYGYSFPRRQRTCAPPMPSNEFHDHCYWGKLRIIPDSDNH